MGYIILGAGSNLSERKRGSGETPGGGCAGTCGRRKVSPGELVNEGGKESGRGRYTGSMNSAMKADIAIVKPFVDFVNKDVGACIHTNI